MIAAGENLIKIEEISEEHPLLRFLSRNVDESNAERIQVGDQTLQGDCLYLVIKRMINMHNDFLSELVAQGLKEDSLRIKPLELSIERSCVALGDIGIWDLHMDQVIKDQSLDTRADRMRASVKMNGRLKDDLKLLDQRGSFARAVQLHCQAGTFDMDAIWQEVNELFLRRLLQIEEPSKHLRRVFPFRARDASAGIGADEALQKATRLQREAQKMSGSELPSPEKLRERFFHIFHSLDHEQIDKLLRGLDIIISSAASNSSQPGSSYEHTTHTNLTMRSQLEKMFHVAGQSDSDLLANILGDPVPLNEDLQQKSLLSTPFSELPALFSFLCAHLSSRDYLYAQIAEPYKDQWDDAMVAALDDLERSYDSNTSNDEPLSIAAAKLEATLVGWQNVRNTHSCPALLRHVPDLLAPASCSDATGTSKE